MALLPGIFLVHHLRVDSENTVKKTLCGLSYEKPFHNLTLAQVENGVIKNFWRELEEEEICKRCLKSYQKH